MRDRARSAAARAVRAGGVANVGLAASLSRARAGRVRGRAARLLSRAGRGGGDQGDQAREDQHVDGGPPGRGPHDEALPAQERPRAPLRLRERQRPLARHPVHGQGCVLRDCAPSRVEPRPTSGSGVGSSNCGSHLLPLSSSPPPLSSSPRSLTFPFPLVPPPSLSLFFSLLAQARATTRCARCRSCRCCATPRV